MAEGIYNTEGRVNNYSHVYCEMAMEAYYEMMKVYQSIDKKDIQDYYNNLEYTQKKLIEITVFSAMCIESFLNDYLAVCLGDEEYYKSFDSLTPLSKVALIANLYFKKEFNVKSKCYPYLKKLISERNDYVHNKSTDIGIFLIGRRKKDNPNLKMSIDSILKKYDSKELHADESINEIKKLIAIFNTDNTLKKSKEQTISTSDNEIQDANDFSDLNALLKSLKTEYRINQTKAEESLKAIKELAVFFDQNDTNIQAVNHLFGIANNRYSVNEERESVYKEPALKMLNLKRRKSIN